MVPGAQADFVLTTDASGNAYWAQGTGTIDGSGAANYMAKWLDSDTLTKGVIYDNGTNVGIGNSANYSFFSVGTSAVAPWLAVTSGGNVGIGKTNPGQALDIVGNVNVGSSVFMNGLRLGASGVGTTKILQSMDASGNAIWATLSSGTGIGLTNNIGAITVHHSDTSSQASVDGSNGNVLQDVTLDTFGHLTGASTVNLDSRYIQVNGSLFTLTGDTGSQTVNHNSTVYIVGGGGLTSSVGVGVSATLSVGAGDGIDVAADSVAVDVTDILGIGLTESSNNIDVNQAYAFNWTGTHTYATGTGIWDSAGNVGIGNTVTYGLLSVGTNPLAPGLIVTSTGNVGIGTTATGSYRLNVAGNVNVGGTATVTGFKMVPGAQADFVLTTDASGNAYWAEAIGGVDGSGTLNYLAKWTPDGDSLGNSLIYDDGVNVGIGTTSPTSTLTLQGTNSNATIGNELLTDVQDRDFSGASGNWSGTNWAIGSGVATHTAGANNFVHTLTATAGKTYLIKATVNTTTVGTIYVQFGGAWGSDIGQTTGTYTQHDWVIKAENTESLRFIPNSTWAGTIDDVTVKEITPSDTVFAINQSDGTIGVEVRSGGADNTYIGIDAGESTTTGYDNTAIGRGALQFNTTGVRNLANGYLSLNANSTGSWNTSLGAFSMQSNTEGSYNTALGAEALWSNTTGLYNTTIGMESLYYNTDGDENVAIGELALMWNETGDRNTALGNMAGLKQETGSNNTFIGYQAGYGPAAYSASGNIMIGYQAGYNETGSNKLYIANSNTSSPLIWGDFSTSTLGFSGNVGIGTTNPVAKLQVAGDEVRIGNAGNVDYATADGDLYVEDALEVDGTVYINSLSIGGTNTDNLYVQLLGVGETTVSQTGSIGISDMIRANKFVDQGNQTYGIDPAGAFFGTNSIRIANGAILAESGGNVGIGTTEPLHKLELATHTSAIGGIGFGTDVELFRGTTNRLDLASGDSLNLVSGNINIGNTTVINSSRLFLAADGSVTTPSFSFSLDTNTGMYRISDDVLSFVTGGLNRITINASGNVGIGTTNPTSKLEIAGTTSTISNASGDIFINPAEQVNFNNKTIENILNAYVNGNVGIGTTNPTTLLDVFGSSGTWTINGVDTESFARLRSDVGSGFVMTANDTTHDAFIATTYNGGDLIFATRTGSANYERLRITDTGNVGIGTTNPTNKLDIVSTSAGADVTLLSLINNDVSANTAATLRFAPTSTPTIRYSAISATNDGSNRISLAFITGNGATITEKMRIDGYGNVGIGTTSPSSSLDVVGRISIAPSGTVSDIGYNGNLTITKPVASGQFINLTHALSQVWSLGYVYNTDSFAIGLGQATDSNFTSPQFVVRSNGYVGIGVTSPAATLHVVGASSWPLRLRNSGAPAGTYWSVGPDTANAFVVYRQTGPPWGVYLTDGATAWVANSDQRLKTNIQTISTTKGVEAIKKLNPVLFNWLGQESSDMLQAGFIAQEVQGIFPDLVSNGPEVPITLADGSTQMMKPLGLNYTGLTPYMVKAIQEQQSQINNLSSEIGEFNLTDSGDLQITGGENYVYDGNLDYETQKSRLRQDFAGQAKNKNEIIDRIGAFSEIVSAKIKSGLIETEHAIVNGVLVARNITSKNISALSSRIRNLTSKVIVVDEKITSPVVETADLTATGSAKLAQIETNTIKPQKEDITIDLNEIEPGGELNKLIIKGLEGKTVASIDTAGNATFSGTLAARNATISGTLAASDATISGKLIAKEVEAENINEIQKILNELRNQPLPDAQYYQNVNPDQLSSFSSLIAESLTVTGQSNLYDLSVANSLTAGNIFVENNSILSLTWELKLSALSSINMFDGAVMIARNGTITTRGTLIAQGGVKTNEITPLNDNDNINIRLKAATSSGAIITNNTSLNILNEFEEVQASIDASGSARFKELALDKYLDATTSAVVIAAPDNFAQNGIFAPAIETKTKVAGNAILPQNSLEVVIYNEKVTDESLIYVTPTTPTDGETLYVAQKVTCPDEAASGCKPYFKVAIDNAINNDVKFNWWIVN
jgi:hypothetical protein